MKRPKVEFSPVYLRSKAQVDYLLKVIPNLPLDPERPVEVVIREQVKKRKLTLNAAMWAGPLADIARLAWHNRRQYTAEEWHEGFKALFLPDPNEPDFDPSHVVNPETYAKWSINPLTGNRMCIGSTTQLTDAGMRVYLVRMEAFAAEQFGVEFSPRIDHAEPDWRANTKGQVAA